jgi:hypothetical protein
METSAQSGKKQPKYFHRQLPGAGLGPGFHMRFPDEKMLDAVRQAAKAEGVSLNKFLVLHIERVLASR